MNSRPKKIALLFGYFPNECQNEIIRNSKGVIQNAAHTLQQAIIEGLGAQRSEDIEIINLPYIGSYPLRYNKMFSPQSGIQYKTGTGNYVVGYSHRFCNLTLYKNISRYQVAYKSLSEWCKKYEENEKVILIYALHSPFMKACADVKKHNTNVKLLQIVPDLPEFMSSSPNEVLNYIKSKNTSLVYKLSKDIDGYILLSDYMRERLPVGRKPYAIVEGIFIPENSDNLINSESISSEKKIILYSGTLAKRYGVMNLVNAFQRIDDNTIELIICGAGDSEKEILDVANIDKRIIFKGQLLRSAVLQLQQLATLLVNPRPSEGEFTKYSFPSKTMEYFASGTPVLMYKLPGIPEEYYQYCFTIDDNSVEALKESLLKIISLSNSELKEIGCRARKFIMEEKNPIRQCEKISNIIDVI